MRKIRFTLLFLAGIYITAFSQEFLYKAGLHTFFDNNEFDGCPVGDSQTMAGVRAAPQIGLGWDEKHRVFIGVDAMHEFGSDKEAVYWDPIAYYEFDGEPFRFYMGAFPRKLALNKYPLFFFQDSIRNYRPTMTGIFWEYSSKRGNYMNAWLDWTSRQTYTVRETFFVGLSGRYNWKVLYGQNFSYMHHFAGVMDPEKHTPVYDEVRMLTSVGIDLSSKTPFDELDINAGWAVGIDRNRGDDDGWHASPGFLSQARIEYRGLGIFNTYYRGNAQGKFYDSFGTQLYWGDRLYRATSYNRLDSYIYFVKTDVVKLKLIYSLHFVKEGMFHEQQFYATFDLDNLKKKKTGKKYQYLWDNWFNREEMNHE